jgi:two-component system, sensor histidine kinase and response regulator
VTLNSMGRVFKSINQLDSALKYEYDAIEYSLKVKDYMNLLYCLDVIGGIYEAKGDHQKALENYRKALMVEGSESNEAYPRMMNNLAGSYLSLGSLDSAVYYAQIALSVAKKSSEKEGIKQANYHLYAAHRKMGKLENAMDYLEQYQIYKDSLYNLETAKKMANLQARYDIEAKQKEIERLEMEHEFQNKSYKQQRLTIALLGIGFLLLSFFAWLLLMGRTRLKKINQMLVAQKNDIQEKQKEIMDRNTAILQQNEEIVKQRDQIQRQALALESLNETKDKLFAIVSHDLKGPVAQLDASLELLLDEVFTEDEFMETVSKIKANTANLQETLNNLLHWSYVQMSNDQQSKPEPIYAFEKVTHTIQLLYGTALQKKLIVENYVNHDVKIMADVGHLNFLIRNLLSNSIKFTPENGKIILTSILKNNFWEFCVQDNGIGIPSEKLNTLFKFGNTLDRRGTYGEKGTGLGLALCKEMVEKNGGSIWITSELGIGTKVFFSLPKAD